MATKICICSAINCAHCDMRLAVCNLSKVTLDKNGSCVCFVEREKYNTEYQKTISDSDDDDLPVL